MWSKRSLVTIWGLLGVQIGSFMSEMGGLDAETLGTETFLVSVLVSVPVRPKMSGLEKVSVSRDFIQKSRSRSRFHETQNESLGLGLDIMRPKLKISVLVLIMISSKFMVFSRTNDRSRSRYRDFPVLGTGLGTCET